MSSPGKKDTTTTATKAEEKAKDVKPDSALELLEEDDEFEEFEGTTWEDAKETEDGQLWQDDWDDDDVNDDFAQQLRQQIDHQASAGGGPAGTA